MFKAILIVGIIIVFCSILGALYEAVYGGPQDAEEIIRELYNQRVDNENIKIRPKIEEKKK